MCLHETSSLDKKRNRNTGHDQEGNFTGRLPEVFTRMTVDSLNAVQKQGNISEGASEKVSLNLLALCTAFVSLVLQSKELVVEYAEPSSCPINIQPSDDTSCPPVFLPLLLHLRKLLPLTSAQESNANIFACTTLAPTEAATINPSGGPFGGGNKGDMFHVAFLCVTLPVGLPTQGQRDHQPFELSDLATRLRAKNVLRLCRREGHDPLHCHHDPEVEAAHCSFTVIGGADAQ